MTPATSVRRLPSGPVRPASCRAPRESAANLHRIYISCPVSGRPRSVRSDWAVQYQHLAVVFCTSVHQPAHRGIISYRISGLHPGCLPQGYQLAHGCFAWFPDFPSYSERIGTPVFLSTELDTCSPASASPLKPCSGENGYYIELVFQQNVQQMLVSYHSSMIGEYGNSFIF